MSGHGRRGRWLASRVASLLKEAQEDDRRAWGTLLLSDSPAGAPGSSAAPPDNQARPFRLRGPACPPNFSIASHRH